MSSSRRRAMPRLGAVLVGVLVLCLAVPAGANARPSRSFFGIQSWATPSEQEFNTIQSARPGTFRFTLLWSVVEFAPGARNWGPMDLEVRGAARHGMRPLPVILGSPRHVASKFQNPPRSRAGKAAYSRFVRDAAFRYGRKGKGGRGSFWRENPQVPYRPITLWQVWNEPNYPSYWYGHPKVREYVSLLKRTRRALRQSDRRAKVLTAGLPNSKTPRAIPARRFLRGIYRTRHARRYFDAVAVHPYASGSRGVIQAVRSTRQLMNRGRDRRVSIYVTELGWGTGGVKTRNQRAMRTNTRGQAGRLRTSLRALIRYRRRLKISSVSWFCFRDRLPGVGESNYWALHAGLFTLDGKAKRAWGTYKRIVRRRR